MGDEPEHQVVPEPQLPNEPGALPEDTSSSIALPTDTSSLTEERRIDEAAKNDYIRDQRWLEVKSWIKLGLTLLVTVVGAAALLVLGVVIMIHHLAPHSWGWLSDEELNEIYRFAALVSSGGIFVQVARFIRGNL